MLEPDADATDSLARQLRDDAAGAASRVDREFRDRLVRLAERLLDARARTAIDAEDVAQSALKSFFHHGAIEPGSIKSRDELWRLLAAIARRKCVKAARRELAAKRGGLRVVPADSDTTSGTERADPNAIPPDVVAALNDLHRQLLAGLDDFHRPICALRLEGYEVGEIVTELGLSLRTVERRLARIRDRLSALDERE